jgi:ABC-type spermidine/putrescine transport system permease subunit II
VAFLVLRSALDEAGPDLELAARGLGAGPVRAFLHVTLPLVRPALLAGAAMSFILSLNEVVLALFLAVSALLLATGTAPGRQGGGAGRREPRFPFPDCD